MYTVVVEIVDVNVCIFQRKYYLDQVEMLSVYAQSAKWAQNFTLFAAKKHFLYRPTPGIRITLSNITRKCVTAVPKTTPTKAKRLPTSSEVIRLLHLARPERWHLAGAVGLLVISSSVTIAVPFCVGKVIDVIYNTDFKKHKQNLTYMCVIFAAIFAVGALANFGRVYLMQTSGQRVVHRLRSRVFSSILKQETNFFDTCTTGELVNRLSSDTVIVGAALTQNASDGLRSSFSILASASMMMYMSTHLALVGLCIVPPVAGMAVVYGKYIRKITGQVQDRFAHAGQVAQERIANIRTVQAFVQEGREQQQYVQRLLSALSMQKQEAFYKATFFGLAGFSGNMIVLSVLWYGGMMMAQSQITIGELTAFLLYAAYLGVNLGAFSNFYSELMKGIGASSKLWYIIDREPVIQHKGGLIPVRPPMGLIEYRNVTFHYPLRPSVKVVSQLNLTVDAGSSIAIVGSSGSGKSTLGTLLLRFYDPVSGSILLDGVDLGQFDVSWLRKNIGLVSQEPVLFASTVRENVCYGVPDDVYSEEKLIAAAKEANAYDFIQAFPQKFDTLVGERGVMLSGGQKQRIAIARALYKNPRILLLDEATSALDSESENLVQDALDRLMSGRTVIIIAHRLSTIVHADQIVVLENGSVSEKGTYANLMSVEHGTFRKLVEHQTFGT